MCEAIRYISTIQFECQGERIVLVQFQNLCLLCKRTCSAEILGMEMVSRPCPSTTGVPSEAFIWAGEHGHAPSKQLLTLVDRKTWPGARKTPSCKGLSLHCRGWVPGLMEAMGSFDLRERLQTGVLVVARKRRVVADVEFPSGCSWNPIEPWRGPPPLATLWWASYHESKMFRRGNPGSFQPVLD